MWKVPKHGPVSRLLHNLRKWQVPEVFLSYMENMLSNHRMKLKFDNYMSDWFLLNNGIGKGNLLSMVLCLLYNADML